MLPQEKYRYISPITKGWLKTGMVGTIREVISDLVVLEFVLTENIAVKDGSSVSGFRSIEVTRAVSFPIEEFKKDLLSEPLS